MESCLPSGIFKNSDENHHEIQPPPRNNRLERCSQAALSPPQRVRLQLLQFLETAASHLILSFDPVLSLRGKKL